MDLALLVLRVTGGVIMIAHGLPKWPNRDRVIQNWARDGMPYPRVVLAATCLVEVPVGLLYVAGVLTGWSSLTMIALMLGMTWWSVGVKRERLVSYGTKGYDVNMVMLALFAATALAGGGAYSADALLGFSPYWPLR
jgi:putative oxidoreductase